MNNTNIYDKWDKEIDVVGLAKDVKEVEANGTKNEYKEVPYGDYEVAVDKMELKSSKKGDPMVSIWFKIVSGEYKGSLIFMNQVVNQAFQIHIVNDILRKMTSEMPNSNAVCSMIEGFKTEFSYKQYANLIMDIFEDINENYEFALSYEKNNKGYNTFDITEVFVLE